MREETLNNIEKIVSSFIDRLPKIDQSKLEWIRKAYPFHAAIFSDEAILYAKQERSIVTIMGRDLYPSLAEVVAKDRYQDVHLDYNVGGKVDEGSLAMIAHITTELREPGRRDNPKHRRPNHKAEMESILKAQTGRLVDKSTIADIYVGDFDSGPLFVEIKSPLPNLDVATESKWKILFFELLKKDEGGRGYLGFAYNPFIEKEKYAHSFTRAIMDMEEEVIMGKEMWDKLGGNGAYEELIKKIDQVGERKREELST